MFYQKWTILVKKVKFNSQKPGRTTNMIFNTFKYRSLSMVDLSEEISTVSEIINGSTFICIESFYCDKLKYIDGKCLWGHLILF